MTRTILSRRSAALLAGVALVHCSGASAQATGGSILQEVVVTAQRKEQNIQDVPLAVSALGQRVLTEKQIYSADDLQLVIPNFSSTPNNYGDSNYTIRGIGATVLGNSADTGVAMHYNGAFLQAGGSSNLYYDLEDVEVLRGPQGTLFGRNATGGAVNMRTKRPDDTLEGFIEAASGEYNNLRLQGAFNLPLGERAAARLAFFRTYYDGDVNNLTTGHLINGNDTSSARLSFQFRPFESTRIDASATYLLSTGTGMQAQKQLCDRDPVGNLGCLPSGLGFGIPNYNATLSGLAAAQVGLTSAGKDPFAGSINPTNLRTVAMAFDPTVYTKEWVATAELEHTAESLTFNYLTAYMVQAGYYETPTDFSAPVGTYNSSRAFPGGFVTVSAPDPGNLGSLGGRTLGSFNYPWTLERGDSEDRESMQEMRLASHFGGVANFLVGAFYLNYAHSENLYDLATPLDALAQLTGATPPFYRLQTPVADLRSYAVFGESYLRLTDTVRLTVGLRWTNDTKWQVNRNLLLNLPAPFEANELHDAAATGRIVLDWKPHVVFTKDTMLYTSYSRGFKGGGFNPQGLVAVAPRFEPEYVDSYEIGAKNTFRAGYLNVDVFHYGYHGLQVSKVVDLTSVNENINATMWGAELEGGLQLTEGLSLDFSTGHLESKIGSTSSIDPRDPTGGDSGLVAVKDVNTAENCVATVGQLNTLLGGTPFGDCVALGLPAGVPTDLKGKELPNAPHWTVQLGGQYEQKLRANLTGRIRLDYSWRSDFWGRIFNDPADRISSWGVFDGQIEIGRPDQSWYVRVEGSNLLDKNAVTGMYLTDATQGLATNLFLLPRRQVQLVAGSHF